jgi:hypothetical protein
MDMRGQGLSHLAFVVANHVLESCQNSKHSKSPGVRRPAGYHLFMIPKDSGSAGNNGGGRKAYYALINRKPDHRRRVLL